LASIGVEVLEVRADQTQRVVDVLRSHGIAPQDLLVIGGTVTTSLRTTEGGRLLHLLAEASIPVRSATTRSPSLDDVYLRLTGDRITVSPN
jgi:hypothetical protein